MRSLRPLLLSFGLALVAACGGGGGGGGTVVPPPTGCITGDGPAVAVTGMVRYERLSIGPSGLGPGLVLKPARHVDVDVRIAGDGTCYGEGSTDDSGAFSLLVKPPAGSQLEVRAYARTDNDPDRHIEVHDALPPSVNVHSLGNVFVEASGSFTAGSATPVDLVVPYNPGSSSSRPSIGFSILDVLETCSDAIRIATGTTPPLCHAYTQLGNTGATGTSFYSNDSKSITFLGGAAGNLDGSDTDYFDDSVIAHEYGHFVEFNMSHTLTRGGPHSGEALEPGFAWSEGQATGFGSVYRKDASYVDTYTTSGGVLIGTNVEHWLPHTVHGIGGEETVAEVIWDLGDGTEGRVDTDGDVAAVSLQYLLQAFLSFQPASDAPYIGLFLDRLVAAGGIDQVTLATMLLSPENQQIGYPLSGTDVWPIPLGTPGTDSNTVDSTGTNPCRGLASSRWYLFRLTASKTITFSCAVNAFPGFGSDLDLFLLRCDGSTVQVTYTGSPLVIGPRTLDAGCYLVRVEANCSGAGNKANYVLSTTVQP